MSGSTSQSSQFKSSYQPQPQIHRTSITIPPRNHHTSSTGITTSGASFHSNNVAKTSDEDSGIQQRYLHSTAAGRTSLNNGNSSSSYGSLPRRPSVPMSGSSKLSAENPELRKIAYNMYRGLLNNKHEKATDVVDAAPKDKKVLTDEGVAARVFEMMRQQNELSQGKMNIGGPPPPPPPPPFPGMTSAKAPMEHLRHAHQPASPPAALAGAMMKERKPFTYTPGGIDLSEINAQTRPQTNGVSSPDGSQIPRMGQAFKLIQGAYDNLPENNSGVQPQKLGATAEAPLKYTGANIPSRSFKMLQQMTEDAPHDRRSSSTSISETESYNKDSGKETSPSLSPSQSLSRIAPSYTTVKDAHVYRQVEPSIGIKVNKDQRVVNSALSSRRESSPRPWHREQVTDHIIEVVRPDHSRSASLTNGFQRLKVTQQDSVSSNASDESVDDTKRLYGGSKIPSRVFRQLQQEYNNDGGPSNNNSQGSSTTGIKMESKLTNPPKVHVVQAPQVGRKFPLNEEEFKNNLLNTASKKETVLNELTSQFDPKAHLKKPSAAPGKVFKFLQQKYDDDDESDNAGVYNNNSVHRGSLQSEDDCDYKPKLHMGGRNPGRTFRMLQDNIETHPSVMQARK